MATLSPSDKWPETRRHKTKRGDALTRPFIAVDAETYHVSDGEPERVMLFGFSSGEFIEGEDLTSHQMIDLIVKVGRDHAAEHPIYVSYGFRYDVSFLLRDLPGRVAGRIWNGTGRSGTWYQGLRWEYRKEKYLRISGRGTDSFSVTIYEVSSFFNKMRMNVAAEKHLKGDPILREVGELVEQGKNTRGSFSLADGSYVRRYWEAENRLLVRLCERLRENCIRANVPVPKDWYGPSAITSQTFKAFRVKDHKRSQNDLPDDFVLACRYAYFGGRFEQFWGGYHKGKVYQYDITSAYPYAMSKLWSWKDATLRYVPARDIARSGEFPEWLRFGVFHVRYASSASAAGQLLVPHPFPYRDTRGAIYYPHRVEGWYWAPEVRANWENADMEILGAWVISPGTEEKPFTWIAEYFALRCKYKANQDPAEYVIKITLNSGYGKTAQRIGWNEETGEPPPFHQLDWAGYITSYCRAMVWEGIKTGNVFQVETDGIFSVAPLDLPLATSGELVPDDLGKWELTEHDEMITLQNGVYWTHDDTGWKEPKFRGVKKGSKGTTPEDARDYLGRLAQDRREAEPIRGSVTSFYGQGVRFNQPHRYMRWLPESREVVFGGGGKRIWFGGGNPARGLVPLHNGAIRETLDFRSAPHPLPWEQLEVPKAIRDDETNRPDVED